MIKKIIEIIKEGRRLILNIIAKPKFTYFRRESKDPNIKMVLNEVRKNGYYVIDNFYSDSHCDKIKSEINRLIKTKNNSKFYHESNDFRIYGSNFKSDIIDKFNKNKFLNDLSNLFYKTNSLAFFTLSALINYKENSTGSGGDWHRDISLPGQFKAMLYINDVYENGPFEYIKNTQNSFSLFYGIIKCNVKSGANRLNSKNIGGFLKSKRYEKVSFKAKKGTLIIFDSFGIHRGSPLKKGHRYAITNYYFTKKYSELNKDF